MLMVGTMEDTKIDQKINLKVSLALMKKKAFNESFLALSSQLQILKRQLIKFLNSILLLFDICIWTLKVCSKKLHENLSMPRVQELLLQSGCFSLLSTLFAKGSCNLDKSYFKKLVSKLQEILFALPNKYESTEIL